MISILTFRKTKIVSLKEVTKEPLSGQDHSLDLFIIPVVFSQRDQKQQRIGL